MHARAPALLLALGECMHCALTLPGMPQSQIMRFVEPSDVCWGRAKKPWGWSLRQALRSSTRRPLAIPPLMVVKGACGVCVCVWWLVDQRGQRCLCGVCMLGYEEG